MKPQFYYIILCLIFLNSCKTDFSNDNIAKIKYGTSFGMCVGYCKHDLELSKNEITYNCSSWDTKIKTITRSEAIKSDIWDSVWNDLNVNAFFNLEEFIGCPDCADGGAEWVEIDLANGQKHKVTFEYGNEPVILKNKIDKLRELLNSNSCN